MANHDVRLYHWPPVIPDQRFNRNGMLPNAALMRRLADTFNFVASRQKKHIAAYSQALNDIKSSASGTSFAWPTYFRTGEATSKMRLSVGFGTAATLTAATLYFDCQNTSGGGGGTTITFDDANESATFTPGAIAHKTVLFDVEPNQEYRSSFTTSGGTTPLYFTLSEAPNALANDSLTGVCNPGAFVAEGPIYDAHIADLIDANNKLWRHNGSHLISYIGYCDWSGGATTCFTNSTSSTTYNNVQDGSTSISDATPGWKLYTTYHATANRTTIPVKMAVQVDRTAGTGTLDIKFTDGTNSISITGIGDPADGNTWSTTTGTIPVQNGTKWDLHWKVSSGTTTFRIRGASLFTYEA